ncbi:hypothetical protein BH10BAC4_BH10BAC4_22740 [soil metagenome]
MENSYIVENKCANCGNLFRDKYCNKCGQRVIHRFSASYLWQGLKQDVIGIESGLVHTLSELWKRPGQMILTYINGATNQYYGPLKYLIFWTAVYLILLSWINPTEENSEFIQKLIVKSSGPFSSDSYNNFVLALNWYMQHHTNFYVLGIIPFISLMGYLFFRNQGFNFTEIAIFYTYFYGQFVFCVIVVNLVVLILSWGGSGISTVLLFVLYFFLFFRMQLQFFKARWKISILNGVGILSLGTILYWLFLFLLFNVTIMFN